MNTTKNTAKPSRKTIEKTTPYPTPQVIDMDSNGGFVENKNFLNLLVYVIAGFLVVGTSYWGFSKYNAKRNFKHQQFLANLNVPRQRDRLVQIQTDAIRDALDTPKENFIESQIGHEFSFRDNILFKDNSPTIDSTNDSVKNISNTKQQEIQTWLMQQRIQGVAYKDFESCLIMNQKIFHLGDLVFPEKMLVWSDIDPVEKKLFFSDNSENLYFINY